MHDYKKKQIKKYLGIVIAGLLLVLIHIWARDIFGQPLLSDKLKMLCDAFFMPAVLIFGSGVMLWIAADGHFDVFAFGFKQLSDTILNRKRKDRHAKDFVEFRQEGIKKNQERYDKEGKYYIPYMLVGLAFFLIAIGFNIAFSMVYV